MAFFLNSKYSKIYPYLISFVTVKNCAHRQTNQAHHAEQLSGPIPPTRNFNAVETFNFRALMAEAATRAQRFLAAEAVKYHIPGISYSVTLDEADPFVSTYGFADMENNKQMQNTSVLRIGYITMLYTAFVAIEMIVRHARRDLTDDLATLVPGFPVKFFQIAGLTTDHTITFNNVLCHTTGMRDYTDAELKSVRRENLAMILQNETTGNHIPLENVPGTYSFARYPYMLLSILINQVNRNPYSTAITESMNILYGPNHPSMQYTIQYPYLFTDNTIDIIKGLSRHYQRNYGGILQPATYVNPANREAIYGLAARPDTISVFGLKLVRNTKDDRHTRYQGNMDPNQAQYMFRPLAREPTFDTLTGEMVYPSVFGRTLYTYGSSRNPTAWCSSSVIGSSSILLVKGFLNPVCNRGVAIRQTPKSQEISVSVLCNLEGVELYSVANQIAGVYQDALQTFHDWRASKRNPRSGTQRMTFRDSSSEEREIPAPAPATAPATAPAPVPAPVQYSSMAERLRSSKRR